MPSATSTILHRTTRGSRPLNILTWPTHERYQSGFAKCNARFYLWQGGDGIKDWKNDYAKLPENHILLNGNGLNQLPIDVDFDLILSQHKFGQLQLSKELAKVFHLPVISLEHTLPMTHWKPGTVERLKTLQGDINIFISEFSRAKWLWDENEADVVHHGVDTELFKPLPIDRKNHILSVVNDWVNRDWCCNFQGWQRITKGLPVFSVGDTKGFSKASASTQELVEFYASSGIFINTSTVSPVPTSLLEAMSCGCAVVTTATCMIPEIVKDGVNGFVSNDEGVLRNRCIQLLNNPTLAKELGENARKTIVDNFGMDKFVSNWDSVFERASNIIYRGF